MLLSKRKSDRSKKPTTISISALGRARLANKIAQRRRTSKEVHREWISSGGARHEDASNEQLQLKVAWLAKVLGRGSVGIRAFLMKQWASVVHTGPNLSNGNMEFVYRVLNTQTPAFEQCLKLRPTGLIASTRQGLTPKEFACNLVWLWSGNEFGPIGYLVQNNCCF